MQRLPYARFPDNYAEQLKGKYGCAFSVQAKVEFGIRFYVLSPAMPLCSELLFSGSLM